MACAAASSESELLEEILRIENTSYDDQASGGFSFTVRRQPGGAVVSRFRIWAYDNSYRWPEAHFVDRPIPPTFIKLNSDEPWSYEGPIRVSVDCPPYDYFSCGALEICSPRLQAVLADEPVEFLPVELSGYPAAGYAALHVMARAPVLDRERSEITLFRDGKIMSVRSIVTDETVSPPAGIFHISESYSGLIFVTFDLAERLEGFIGLCMKLPTGGPW